MRAQFAPMPPSQPVPSATNRQDDLYAEAAAGYGAALERLARAYEADPERRRDLLQELHLALWQSLAIFDGRCSLRTWVYRVAHNVGASHVIRDRRAHSRVFVGLEALDTVAGADAAEGAANRRHALERLLQLILRLKPLDRQVMLLYLEDVDAASIGEITGLSERNVATKVHRIKQLLARQFREGSRHGQ
jgi:RNA polymerase sigma-70 factor (ECF subfamily)